MNIYRVSQPFVFTIFGASGDLAKLKIFPALFALAEQKRFLKDFWIIGYARTKKSQEAFREEFSTAVKASYARAWGDYQTEILDELLTHVFYFSGQYDNPEDFEAYRDFCQAQTKCEQITQIAHFSVPPSLFEIIVKNIAHIRKNEKDDIRLVLEKPFGDDEASAQKMFHTVTSYFSEDQVYLLDHYLGKKAVRSLILLRNMNRILNLMLKGREVDNIQISALETLGVGHRSGYFDGVGTVKDMIQSHLLQLLGLVTMSIPIEKTAQSVQKEKAGILSSLHFVPKKENIVLGQYKGYQNESPKTKGSQTPTFGALKLWINRESWYGVPIYLRTGKKLHQKSTYIVIELKKFAFQKPEQEPNRVIIELSPSEKLHIRLLDEDGITSRLGEIGVSESIACQGDYCLPEHGLLLLDVLRKEKMFFLSFQEILACWNVIDEVTDFIKKEKLKPTLYAPDTCGPSAQEKLIAPKKSWYAFGDQTCS